MLLSVHECKRCVSVAGFDDLCFVCVPASVEMLCSRLMTYSSQQREQYSSIIQTNSLYDLTDAS